jgi:hypothetical protein
MKALSAADLIRPVPAWRLWSVASALAACETWLNFAARPGLNWLLSTLASSLLFISFSAHSGKPASRGALTSLLLACLLAGGICVTADGFMEALLLAGVLGSLATAVVISISTDARDVGLAQLLLSPALAGVAMLREARKRFCEGLGSTRAESNRPVMRGIALAAPVTVLFSLLLSNADPLLAAWRDSLVRALQDLSFLGRGGCFALFGIVSLGTLGLALEGVPSLPASSHRPEERILTLGPIERRIVLWAVVMLFALFLALQVSHLFGNPAALRGNGVTYAQTVHQGFNELTLVASLCALLLILLSKSSASGALTPVERTLSGVLILQTLLLLVSAFHRMALYESVYGYTELRLFVQVYIGWVGIVLIGLGVELAARPDFNRLTRRCAVLALSILAALSYWNHAGWIAKANLQRFQRSGLLDVQYVAHSLGPDAVPVLVNELPQLPEPLQAQLRHCLSFFYTSNASDADSRAWYEWNYRRSRLNDVLRQAALTTATPSDSKDKNAPCYR